MKTTTNNGWTRLDNAALIYTSTLSKDYATNFRVSVNLKDNIDKADLQQALDNCIDRFPSFRYQLKDGLYWSYLRTIKNKPILSDYGPLRPLPFTGNHGYLFKLSCDSSLICLDVFHSLCDGVGAMTFLLSIAGEYLRIHNNLTLQYNSWVLDPSQAPSDEEVRDGFDSFTSPSGSLEKDKKAYHVRGEVERKGVLNNTRISIPTCHLKQKSKEYNCTITEYLTSLMILSIQRLRDEDPRRRKSPHIKISVPVNLRSVFGEKTLRNFSSYVNLGVDVSCGNCTLEEIIREVSLQKRLQTIPRHLEAKVNGNTRLEGILAIRMIPRALKKRIMSYFAKSKGDRFISQTLSNLGSIDLPEAMKAEITDLDFQLGRQTSNFGACGCVSFGGKTNINMSRMIAGDRFEQVFMQLLDEEGIPVQQDLRSLSAREFRVGSQFDKMIAATFAACQGAFAAILLPFTLIWNFFAKFIDFSTPFIQI